MSKVYCGLDEKPPKGKRFGTMQECMAKNQVRRYGRFKIDPVEFKRKELNKIKEANVKVETSLRADIIGIKKKIRMIEEDLEKNKDKKRRSELKKDKKRQEEKLETTRQKLKLVREIMEKNSKVKQASQAKKTTITQLNKIVKKPKKSKKQKKRKTK